MGRKLPSESEFEIKENEVVHKPTGASWSAYPGRPEPAELSHFHAWQCFAQWGRLSGA